MRIPARFAPLLFSGLLSAIMVAIVSGPDISHLLLLRPPHAAP